MTVRLNEVALSALLDTQEGPVGQDLQRRAQAVTALARENVAFIMHRVPGVAQDVDYVMQGSQAVIGIRDAGSISEYLVDKENVEFVWLVPALQAGALV